MGTSDISIGKFALFSGIWNLQFVYWKKAKQAADSNQQTNLISS